MLTDAHRRLLINELIRGIESIGPQFEAFSQTLVDYISPEELTHRGINSNGQPVGDVVDSVSASGEVVAEYSAEENYFKPPFKKIFKDLKHARKLHRQRKLILLFSSQLCGPSASTRLVNLNARSVRRMNTRIEIYDSRRQAEHIVDELLFNDNAIEALARFLPTVKKVAAEFAATDLMPRLPDWYVPRLALENSLIAELSQKKSIALSGLSGTGKSLTIVATAASLRHDFELIIWIAGSDIKSVEQLAAYPIKRYGHDLNVLNLLKERSCLVVLDDFRFATVDELASLCGPKSKIIATRQSVLAGDIEIPYLNHDESRKLLESDIAEQCPFNVFEMVWQTVNGHPLALRLMNAAVREGSWSDLLDDCTAIGSYQDEYKLQLLAERLLGRLLPILKRELVFFEWCGSSRVDRSFAKEALQPNGIRKLQKNCILTADRVDVVRVHDIVFSVLPSMPLDVAVFENEFDSKFDNYVNKLAFDEAGNLSLLNFVQIHQSMFKKLLRRAPRRGACLFVLAHSWSGEHVDESLVADLFDWSSDIANSKSPIDIEISAICEAIEALYRKDKHTSPIKEAREKLELYLPVFDRLATAEGISKRSKRTALHHKAKALRNLQRNDEAIQIFEEVLSDFHHPATKLLLARELMRKESEKERAKDMLFDLLNAAKNDPEKADISSTLGAIEALGRYEVSDYFRKALEEFGTFVSKLIIDCAIRGYDQAYVSFAAIGRDLKYNDAPLFISIFTQLPTISPAEAKDDKERANWGHILLQASDAIPEEKEKHLVDALRFYSQVSNPDAFMLQEMGHAFVELGKYDEAIDVLTPKVGEQPNAWRLQWLSKALFGKGDFPNALKRIDEALADSNPKTKKYHAGMYQHRFEIRQAMNDPEALDDLRKALDFCTNPKHRKSLEDKLNINDRQ